MSDPALPPSLVDDITALRRRIEALETIARSPVIGTTPEGTVRVYDADGDAIVHMGTDAAMLSDISETDIGLSVVTVDNDKVLLSASETHGLGPQHAMGFIREATDTAVTVAAGSGDTLCWRVTVGRILADCVVADFALNTGASADCAVTIETDTGGATTSALNVGTSFGGFVLVRWEHGLTIGAGPYTFEVHVDVTGSGNADVFPPRYFNWCAKPVMAPQPAGGLTTA